MFGGEPHTEGRGDPRVHQQDQLLLPSLYRLGFELGLASKNKILGEFSCKTPSTLTEHVPHFSVTFRNSAKLEHFFLETAKDTSLPGSNVFLLKPWLQI